MLLSSILTGFLVFSAGLRSQWGSMTLQIHQIIKRKKEGRKETISFVQPLRFWRTITLFSFFFLFLQKSLNILICFISNLHL